MACGYFIQVRKNINALLYCNQIIICLLFILIILYLMCKFNCRGDTKECPCECTKKGCRIMAMFAQIYTVFGLVLGWAAMLTYYILGFIATIEIVSVNSPANNPDVNCENLPCFCYSVLNLDAPLYIMSGIFSGVVIYQIVKMSEMSCGCKILRAGCCGCCPRDVSGYSNTNDDNGPLKPEQAQEQPRINDDPVISESARQEQDGNRLCICDCSVKFCLSPWWRRMVNISLILLIETMILVYLCIDASTMIIINTKSMIGGAFGTPKYSSMTMTMVILLITTDLFFAIGSIIFTLCIFLTYMRSSCGGLPPVANDQYNRVSTRELQEQERSFLGNPESLESHKPPAYQYVVVDKTPSAPSATMENI